MAVTSSQLRNGVGPLPSTLPVAESIGFTNIAQPTLITLPGLRSNTVASNLHPVKTQLRWAVVALGAAVAMAIWLAIPAPAHAAAPIAVAFGSRLLFDVGMFAVVGVAFIVGWAFPVPPERARTLLICAWTAYASGVVAITEAQREAAGLQLGGLFGAKFTGGDILLRLLLLAAGSALVLRTTAAPTLRRSHLATILGCALVAMFLDDLADAAVHHDPLSLVLVRFTHFTSAGLWMGGLAVLLLTIRGLPSGGRTVAIRRFSTAAGISLVVVAASGVARAAGLLHSWSQLTTTTFGCLVLIKVGVFALLVGLGSINRFVTVPEASRSLRGLRRVASLEVIIGVSAVAVSVGMLNVPPPS